MTDNSMIFTVFFGAAFCISYILNKQMAECVKREEMLYKFAVKAADNLSFGYLPIEKLTSATEKELLEAMDDVYLKQYLDKYRISDLSELKNETDKLVAYTNERLKKARFKYEKEKPLVFWGPIALQLLVCIFVY